MTTVLQLGAGPLMGHSIRLLRDAGYRVYAADRNPNAPSFALADGFAPIDIVDADAVTEYAARIGADVVLAINDVGVPTAAEASRRLGLPGLSPEAAPRCVDKGLMRECWAAAGLPQPAFRVVDSADAISHAAAEIGYPVVVKPALNGGSRGVSLVPDAGGLPWAIEFASAYCRNGRYVVEAAIRGTEITCEGLVQRGRARVVAISDKEPWPHPRYRTSLTLNYPAALPEHLLALADDVVTRAAIALGIENGAFHCECMVNEGGVYLLEMGARPGGGHIFGQLIEATSGICMPRALVEVLLGEPVDLTPRWRRGACYRYFSPPAGILRRIANLDEARRLPGVLDLAFTVQPGGEIKEIAVDTDKPGYVAAAGSDRAEAKHNADRAVALLEFVIEPLRPPEEVRPAAP